MMKPIILFLVLLLYYTNNGLCQDSHWVGKYGTRTYYVELNRDSTFYFERWHSFPYTTTGRITISGDTIFTESTKCRVGVIESTTDSISHSTVSIIRAGHHSETDYIILYIDDLPFEFVQLKDDTVVAKFPKQTINSISIYYRDRNNWELWSHSTMSQTNNTYHLVIPEACPVTFVPIKTYFLISGRNKLISENGAKWKRLREKPDSRLRNSVFGLYDFFFFR